VIWADPDRDFRSMVRGVPVFWSAFGVVRPPAADAAVFGGAMPAADEPRWAWRFVSGTDTLTYVARGAGRSGGLRSLDAEWRNERGVVARCHTEYDGNGWPARAEMEFPDVAARLQFTVAGIDTTVVVPPALWRARR
jgi:hypothetical protein